MRLQPLNRFGRWGVFQQPARMVGSQTCQSSFWFLKLASGSGVRLESLLPQAVSNAAAAIEVNQVASLN